jgi:hypothetical protein
MHKVSIIANRLGIPRFKPDENRFKVGTAQSRFCLPYRFNFQTALTQPRDLAAGFRASFALAPAFALRRLAKEASYPAKAGVSQNLILPAFAGDDKSGPLAADCQTVRL